LHHKLRVRWNDSDLDGRTSNRHDCLTSTRSPPSFPAFHL
jgi:hypothetical protein